MEELEQEPSSSASSRSALLVAVFLVAASSLVAASCAPSSRTTASTDASHGIVRAVVDGDTLDLEIEGTNERVRLIGIDTPESVSNTTPDQCFGAEATEALRGLLPVDTMVDIERDLEPRDRYGRLLLYVSRRSDQLFVNEWMVEHGFANAITYEPNDRLTTIFTGAEADARADNRGLWAHCDGPDQPLE